MECEVCRKCPNCNYEGCYYCHDYIYTEDGYICVCKDGNDCPWKRTGDCK